MSITKPSHVAMDQFVVRNGEWVVGDVPLSMLAARVGQTPFYAYDRALLRSRVADLRKVLPKELQIHYAMKANPMPALVGEMVGLVDGIDVASAGELKVALDAGAKPSGISFAGPGKRDTELRQAVASGVLVSVESLREVTALAHISQSLGQMARVAVRINPEFELKSSGMKMGGGASPFGVDAAQVPELLKAIGRAGLGFEGFHLYVGSQNLHAQALCEAQLKSYELVLQLAQFAPGPVRYVNLGGGFGIPYFAGEQRLNVQPVADQLAQLMARAGVDLPQAAWVLELGRYLVGEAGVYVARVLDRKVSNGKVFLVTDGGLHHHLAASGNFGQVIRKNYPVTVSALPGHPSGRQTLMETVSVVGPLCTPLDVLAQDMALPVAEVGDLVVVFQSGAYGASASPQMFLGHPPCLEVLV